jgi:DNA-binding NtrC family response regulator
MPMTRDTGERTHTFEGAEIDRTPATVRGFSLEVVDGDDLGVRWESSEESGTVGTHDSCDLRLSDSTVSRFHCEVSVGAGGVRVRDLESSNGTLLDGIRIIEAYARTGSLLRLGRTVVQFRYLDRAVALQLSARTRLGALVGHSVPMRAAFSVLERAAATRATTLLEGETGTGKSAAARAIHSEGGFAAHPFVTLDCGAIPANLLESELFGHERGAFTGAVAARAGAFEEAGEGTIFLDEIGELPSELQPKLLGVLEDKVYRRLGSNVVRPMRARIICATNRDLRTEVNLGRFREDLYYRIAVVSLTLPPLRERPEDVEALARQLLHAMGAEDDAIDQLLSAELIAALRRAAWPGNVRELRNYLEKCLVFHDALPAPPEPSGDGGVVLEVDATKPFSEARDEIMAAFERSYITELLRLHDGTVSKAAEAAQIDRTYLYKLLRRYGGKK